MFYNGALDPLDKLWQAAQDVCELEAELMADPVIADLLDGLAKEDPR